MEPLLAVKSVTRILPADIPVTLVRDASLEIFPGEFVSITGPSGSGKSSLLYLLGLLDRPTTGDIFLSGRDITHLNDNDMAEKRLENLGFIFQFHFLLPEFTALENVMMPMRKLGKLPMAAMKDKGAHLLERLGLKDHMHKIPRKLSGGQAQRVAIARALANDPMIILADEPTGNLDTASSQTVQKILKDIAHTDNRAVVAVTHDMDFAKQADRQVRIVDGRIT